MSSGASPGPVDARPTSGKGGNLRATKCPRPGRTGHGPPKAAATKRAGAHWPTLAQGRLARRVTSIADREHQAPRSHRNVTCRVDSRDRPAIAGHLQPGCAAALRHVASLSLVRASPESRRSSVARPPRFHGLTAEVKQSRRHQRPVRPTQNRLSRATYASRSLTRAADIGQAGPI